MMETVQRTSRRPPGIRELPIVAGHLALDFGNTVDDPLGPERFDHVIDYEGLVNWSERVRILPDGSVTTLRSTAEQHPRRAATVVSQADLLRSAINETFGAVIEGRVPTGGWIELQQFAATAIQHAGLVPAGPQLAPTWDFSELESPLWPVAESAYALLKSPLLGRLKRCAGCPWLFLDQSKNNSRRWCSMEICGTDQKIRRYVAKRADRRTP